MSKYLIEYESIFFKIKKINKRIRLPYLQKFMLKLEDQSSSNLYKLRKEGNKLCMRNGEYYIITKKRKLNLNSKRKIVNNIFNMKIDDYKNMKDYLYKNFIKNTIKSSKLTDANYSIILNILATFWISDGSDISTLTLKKLKIIKKYEAYSYLGIIESSNKTWFEIIKTTPERLKYFEDTHKRQTKKWKKSKTYRLNKITRSLKNFTSKWAYIDNTNKFQFLGRKYILDKEIEGYKVKADFSSNMDHILCIKDYDRNLIEFYDMDILLIPPSKILDVG